MSTYWKAFIATWGVFGAVGCAIVLGAVLLVGGCALLVGGCAVALPELQKTGREAMDRAEAAEKAAQKAAAEAKTKEEEKEWAPGDPVDEEQGP